MTRLLFLVLAAIILLMPAKAEAASFDCSKATSSFEHAICDDPALSDSDDRLAQAYATALGGLSKPAADEVRAAQRQWLDYAQRVCTDEAEPLIVPYTEDQRGCLNATFLSRTRDLEQSRMLGGFRFYPVNRYLVEEATEAMPEDFNQVATKDFATLRIDGIDATATAFNAMTEANRLQVSDFWDGQSDRIDSGDVTNNFIITTTLEAVAPKRISLRHDNYWYGHGAAHGQYDITYRHFLRDENRVLEAGDIFDGDDWQKRVTDLAMKALTANPPELEIWDDAGEAVAKAAVDPARWNFTDAGLVIQFQPYEVTAYAAGAPTATIAWPDLEGVLTGDALEIADAYP